MQGRIQSVQSFSTVDGPGTRCVIFLQGCNGGCRFCHNPDSWKIEGGEQIEVGALLRRVGRFKPFLKSRGLTISGGEPLLQADFTIEIARQAKAEGWHIALDTCGWAPTEVFGPVVESADLVMISIKHPLSPEKISSITKLQIDTNLSFLATLDVPVRLRYVLIPGWTDSLETLDALRKLAARLPNLETIEILPYNSLACSKWEKLGWEKRMLKSSAPVNEQTLREAEAYIRARWM